MEYWIYNEKTNTYICSVCNTEIENDYDFCPICGYRHHMTTTIDEYIKELKKEIEYHTKALDRANKGIDKLLKRGA